MLPEAGRYRPGSSRIVAGLPAPSGLGNRTPPPARTVKLISVTPRLVLSRRVSRSTAATSLMIRAFAVRRGVAHRRLEQAAGGPAGEFDVLLVVHPGDVGEPDK